MIFLLRDAAREALRSGLGEAGRRSDYPKKGRRASPDDVGFDLTRVTRPNTGPSVSP